MKAKLLLSFLVTASTYSFHESFSDSATPKYLPDFATYKCMTMDSVVSVSGSPFLVKRKTSLIVLSSVLVCVLAFYHHNVKAKSSPKSQRMTGHLLLVFVCKI